MLSVEKVLYVTENKKTCHIMADELLLLREVRVFLIPQY
jgi:hypothetical protein